MREAIAAFVGVVGVVVGAGIVVLFHSDDRTRVSLADERDSRVNAELLLFREQIDELLKKVDGVAAQISAIDLDPFSEFERRLEDPEIVKLFNELDKADTQSLIQLSETAESWDLRHDANAILKRVLLQDPDNAYARTKLDYVKYNGRWTRSWTLWPSDAEVSKRFKAIDKSDVKAFVELADWARTQGEAEDANRILKSVLVQDPENADARSRLGFVKQDGKWMTALQIELERKRKQ